MISKFTISNGGGDGAYLCIEPVSKEIYEYFVENNLDLEEFALDYDHAEANNIPENMQPFEAGSRASFGTYECGMTATGSLELLVEDEESEEVVIKKKKTPDLVLHMPKATLSSLIDSEPGQLIERSQSIISKGGERSTGVTQTSPMSTINRMGSYLSNYRSKRTMGAKL